MLNNHGSTGIRKQKFIGTRKHDSEASKTSNKHMSKNPDSSMSTKNIQGTSTQMKSDDKESIGGDSTNKKRRGCLSNVVEPRSYRDVLMNDEEQQTMT